MTKLTKAQRELLIDLADAWQPSTYCDDRYKPAIALVGHGFATWAGTERLAITPAGRAALAEQEADNAQH